MFAARTQWDLHNNAFAEALAEAQRQGRQLLDLTVSNPTEAGFAYPDEGQRAWQSGDGKYDPQPQGSLKARRSVCDYYEARGESVEPEQLFLTVGTSEAYSFLFRLLCDPGDAILVPAPSYPLLEFLAGIQDVELIHYPLIYDHGWQIDLHALQRALTPKTRAVIVVNPNNPTGSYVSPTERLGLSTFCREHDLALIADEVFLDYSLEGSHASLVTNRDALTFAMSGVSKVAALPQMKVGWLALNGPEAMRSQAHARLEVIADTYLSVSTPAQQALPSMLEERKHMQPQILDRIRRNLVVLDHALQEAPACSRLAVQGGWYAIVRVPVLRTDEALALELIRGAGVVVHPGHFFDFPSEGFFVVSLITPEASFQSGMQCIFELFRS
jgi:alanine-synthesizing transaminase